MKIIGGSIADRFTSRENNFDIIRLLAAALVIFSHSYPLTLGSNASEPFSKLTNGQETFGGLGVSIFFIISGFLITFSYERSANIFEYFRNRILRIYPALIVLILLTVFVLGPILTTVDGRTYLLNPATLRYLESFMLVNMQYSLPGVFEHNPYPNAVNGSLWTLWYELFFYMVVAVLGSLKLLKKSVLVPLFVIVLVISLKLNPGEAVFQYFELFKYFGMGMIVYLFRREIKLNKYAALLSVALLWLFTWTDHYKLAFIFCGTYLIFFLGLGISKLFKTLQERGDFSYGMYIYAFPVQQIVSYVLKDHVTPMYNFIIAAPITLILSILSWNYVEKRSLQLKKKKI
ncbi:acyltransferase family protein [Paenibacillus kobensis]|uniref:acyltransferase family protein n=1 Tax=Paenibacillus kobensis TaxID=59841 RepID=UPI000FD7F30D|nr:acyltransferase [Paenibacillus kobensis]